MRRLLAALVFTVLSGTVLAADAESVLRQSHPRATSEEWRTRLEQDRVQALCSRYRNRPPASAADEIAKSESESFRYPESGRLMGDWRVGEKLAGIGTGGHIGRIQPDPPGRRRGGNCYACHVLAPTEVSAGNLGPILTGYGHRHGHSPEAQRYTYRKIFNPQAFFPCTSMPRFGHNGWLTPEEIADAVAFLLDPESPVNR